MMDSSAEVGQSKVTLREMGMLTPTERTVIRALTSMRACDSETRG